MKSFDENLVLETINMIRLYNLDIRTVTLSISLRDCIDRDVNVLCKRIREKLLKYSQNLVKFAQEVGDDYAIPIVNKRIAVTPISIIGESCDEYDYVKIAKIKNVTNILKNMVKEVNKKNPNNYRNDFDFDHISLITYGKKELYMNNDIREKQIKERGER